MKRRVQSALATLAVSVAIAGTANGCASGPPPTVYEFPGGFECGHAFECRPVEDPTLRDTFVFQESKDEFHTCRTDGAYVDEWGQLRRAEDDHIVGKFLDVPLSKPSRRRPSQRKPVAHASSGGRVWRCYEAR